MKLVLISIALLSVAILVSYFIRKEKKGNQPNQEVEQKLIDTEQLSPESSVTIQEKSDDKKDTKKPKRKYTKKTSVSTLKNNKNK